MTEKIKIDEEEINSILNSYEMQGTPELSNVDNNKTLHKENENSKVTKKNSNIPFISKNKKENNEETTEVIKKEKKPVDVNRKDEIDTLVCDIMKNPKRLKESIKIAQNTSSSLDFDEVEDITNINHIDEIYNTYFQENCTKNTKQVLNPNRKINKSNLTNKTSASHEKIIDPATLNEKEEFSNSEIIKCITEVSLNSKWYGFSFSTKSKIFWNEVSQSKSFKNIFQNYKPDTLKKYWILLSEIKEKDKLISVIEKYRNIIDCSKLKLLTVITLISDYLKGKIKSFEHAALALLTNDKTILMKFLGNKTQRDTDIEHISKRFSFTTADNVDVNHNEQPLQIDDEALNTLLQEDDHTTTNNNKEFNHLYKTIPRKDNFPNSKWRGLITSEKDKAIFNDIDNIVAEFSLFFPNHTEQEILKALKNNSFDISLTYLYLSDPTEFEYLTFTDVDDYVVKNMKNSDHYQRLIEEKGEYVVQERIKFFNLEEEII